MELSNKNKIIIAKLRRKSIVYKKKQYNLDTIETDIVIRYNLSFKFEENHVKGRS